MCAVGEGGGRSEERWGRRDGGGDDGDDGEARSPSLEVSLTPLCSVPAKEGYSRSSGVEGLCTDSKEAFEAYSH